MNKPIFGISGVRGIVGESLKEDDIKALGVAFSSYIKEGDIVIGRDTRKTGKWIKDILTKTLCKAGCNCIDIGVCPTPTVVYNTKILKCRAGIAITASHNPENWNGLKFIHRQGRFLNKQEIEVLYSIRNKKRDFSPSVQNNTIGEVRKDKNGIKRHIDAILKNIDTLSIKDKHFKVCLDACNAALSVPGKLFLQELGCEVIDTFSKPGEPFPRNPEPIPENLNTLKRIVKNENADIGFASDPDGDRLSIVTDKGKAVGEEYTLALVSDFVLKEKKGNVVINLSTSRMTEDIFKKNCQLSTVNCQLIRTPIGEANVVEEMLKSGAILGGEGNGGVIIPEIQYTRDAIAGMGKILEYMAASGEKISTLVSNLPKYYMLKKKINGSMVHGSLFMEQITDNYEPITKLLSKLPNGKINYEDGMRLDFGDGWLHIRKSNTEPVVRIICETKEKKLTEELVEAVIKLIERLRD